MSKDLQGRSLIKESPTPQELLLLLYQKLIQRLTPIHIKSKAKVTEIPNDIIVSGEKTYYTVLRITNEKENIDRDKENLQLAIDFLEKNKCTQCSEGYPDCGMYNSTCFQVSELLERIKADIK